MIHIYKACILDFNWYLLLILVGAEVKQKTDILIMFNNLWRSNGLKERLKSLRVKLLTEDATKRPNMEYVTTMIKKLYSGGVKKRRNSGEYKLVQV